MSERRSSRSHSQDKSEAKSSFLVTRGRVNIIEIVPAKKEKEKKMLSLGGEPSRNDSLE